MSLFESLLATSPSGLRPPSRILRLIFLFNLFFILILTRFLKYTFFYNLLYWVTFFLPRL